MAKQDNPQSFEENEHVYCGLEMDKWRFNDCLKWPQSDKIIVFSRLEN